MTSIYKAIAAVVLPVGVLLSVPAFAEDAPASRCACVGKASDRTVGTFTAVNGDVSTLGANGLTPAGVRSRVSVGSRVVTGPNGTATIVFGKHCNLSIDPNSDVDVQVSNRNYCVVVAQSDAGAGGGFADPVVAGEGLSAPAIIGGVAVLGGVGAALAVGSQSSRSVSP